MRDANCTRCRQYKTADKVCALPAVFPRSPVMVILGKQTDKPIRPPKCDRENWFIHYARATACIQPVARDPTKGELKACKFWVDKQIEKVRPKYVLLVGSAALMSITGAAGIKKVRGVPFEKDGIIYLATYSETILAHDPTLRPILEADLRLFDDIVANGGVPRSKGVKPHLVTTWEDVEEMIDACVGKVSFDIETTCLYPWDKNAAITLIGIGTSSGEYSVPWNVPDSPWSDDDLHNIARQLEKAMRDCFVIMHGGKFDCLWMKVHHSLNFRNDFDTMMASYILDENRRHGLKELAQKYLGAPNWDVDKTTKQGGGSFKELAVYHAHDLFYTRKLCYYFRPQLDEDQQVKRVFDRILMPITRAFVDVEYDGLYVDETKFDEVEDYLKSELSQCEKTLKQFGNINWGSTKELSDLLYKKLKLPVKERTPKGAPSCSESALKQLDHPMVEALLKFRGARQQLSFFIEGWKPYLVYTSTGVYLHPSFKIHGTVTGRLSAEHPNPQQIPRDKRIRSLITAPPGWVLVEVDLEQIELKVTAELSGDRTMREAFRSGVDIHWLTAMREIERGQGLPEVVIDTACKFKGVKSMKYHEAIRVMLEMGPSKAAEINPEWKEYRKKAKAVNFGYVFGMWWRKFKEYARNNYDVKLTDEQAQASRKFFFQTYDQLESWHNRQKAFARRNGYVRSISGRKRRLPKALLVADTPERREAERQSINSPVQSFANDINLMTVLQLREEFGRDVVRICATVHDAILMRVRVDQALEVTNRALQIMKRPKLFDEFDIHLSVPISADAKIGPWGDSVSPEKWHDKHHERDSSVPRMPGNGVHKQSSRIMAKSRR